MKLKILCAVIGFTALFVLLALAPGSALAQTIEDPPKPPAANQMCSIYPSQPSAAPAPDSLPWKVVEVNLQIHLEKLSDVAGVERLIGLVESKNPAWRTSIFVSPEFARAEPQTVDNLQQRGYQIGVLGIDGEGDLTDLTLVEQIDALKAAIETVQAAVSEPTAVVDWKPGDYRWNNNTLVALQNLGMRSISDVFTCGKEITCQCPHALSLGKVTFPYPLQTNFWTVPVSDIAAGSQTLILDDQRFADDSEGYVDFLTAVAAKYQEQLETRDPLIVALHGGELGISADGTAGFEAFLDQVGESGGKVVPIGNLVTESYITNFNVVGPAQPVNVGAKATLNVSYTSTLYCPKYRYRFYGKYESEEWKLIGSKCEYVQTGNHSFNTEVTIPQPPGTQTVYTVRAVGQASYGSCDASDPNWPTVDKYEVIKEVPIQVQPRCIPLPERTHGETSKRLDVLFVPDTDYGAAADINTWLPTFTGHINNQIDQRLNGKEPVAGEMDRFNFYYTRDQGDASSSACGSSATLPTNILADCSYIDTVVVFHTTEFGDCSSVTLSPNILSAEGPLGRSFIHEGGHGIFGLADEYDGPTRYFQPDPNPNIWATEELCRTDATAQGWTADDCNRFTTRQDDWWKLGTTAYIMNDGTHFDNGWGAPGERRINGVLSAYSASGPTPLLGEGVLVAPTDNNTTSLVLTLNDSGFSLNDQDRARDDPPTPVSNQKEYFARLLDGSGQTLGDFAFGDARFVGGEPGYTGPAVLASATFTLNIPYYYNGKTVELHEKSGTLLNSFDLTSLTSGAVQGTVTGSGAAVVGAQVEFIGGDMGNTTTDAGGVYRFEGLTAGSYTIRVIPPLGSNLLEGNINRSVSAGTLITQDFSLAAGTSVSGRVTTLSGKPQPNVILYMTGFETPRYRTDSSGNYAMKAISAGSYTLNIEPARNYKIYVNGSLVTTGNSVALTAVAGQGLTVDFVSSETIWLPRIRKPYMVATPYSWIEATAGGTIVAAGDDVAQGINLPFTFNFYGTNYTSLYVTSNGFISFGSSSTAYSNSCLPSSSTPNNAIYAFWDDLVPNGGSNGNVYAKQTGAGEFVIQWNNVRKYGASEYNTFEIILRSDNSITLQYKSLATVTSMTSGVENSAGTLAKQVYCNGSGLAPVNNSAVRLTTP